MKSMPAHYEKIGNPPSTAEHSQTTPICSKKTKKILFPPFLRLPIILLPESNGEHASSLQKIGNPPSTAEDPSNYPYLLRKNEKNSISAVFEIANNFIAGI